MLAGKNITLTKTFSLLKMVLIFTILVESLTSTTRSSADADNRLDAFSGQSRSTNMVPFHM